MAAICCGGALKKSSLVVAAFLLLLTMSSALRSETREQWIELGARVHGAFGAFIPVGIRIGLDAREKLKADPRGLVVTFYSGEQPPCPCVADGVMIATQAGPGQGTLRIAAEKAPPGAMSVIIIQIRKTGEGRKKRLYYNTLPSIRAVTSQS
jgi:formylmethanofuran dehydrogenase subunit E